LTLGRDAPFMRALALALLLIPAVGHADPRPLRVLGETAAGDRFVIDAVLEEGFGPLSLSVDEGWFAVLGGETWRSGELEGQCVEDRCAFSVDQADGKLILAGDVLNAGPTRLERRNDAGETTAKATATLSPITDIVPGHGLLAPATAITAAELDDLLAWNGVQSGAFNPAQDEPPGDSERESLAAWQTAQDRPGSGLLFTADLLALKMGADSVKTRVGWSEGPGVAYPAGLLRSLSASFRGERRFASDDGLVSLIVASEPPISEEAWDAFVDSRKEAADGYTRVNDDYELIATKDGIVTAEAHHHGETAQRRMVLTYPADRSETWDVLAGRIKASFFRQAGK
jgi:hypothetical protein